MQNLKDEFMTLVEVEEFFDIGKTTLYYWRRSSRLGFPKPLVVGQGKLMWKRSEIASWLEARPRR